MVHALAASAVEVVHALAASAAAVEVVASSMQEEVQDPRGTDPLGRVMLGIARTSYDMLGCARMFVNVLVNVHGQVLYNVTETSTTKATGV